MPSKHLEGYIQSKVQNLSQSRADEDEGEDEEEED